VALLAIPILDTTVAVTSRLYRGISPFTGGRDHLSHRLMRIGIQRKYAAITLWAASGVYGLLAYVIYQSQNSAFAIIAGAGWVALLVFFMRIPSEDK
jgi:UDP-GlcNAc:undecaprenyl-phosphate GlcNAc-1-phosphate transferase